MKYLVNRETKEHIRYNDDKMSPVGIWKIVEADADGWIPWNGGECPLPASKLAEVKLQDGQQGRFESIDLLTHRSWQKWNCGGDIIAYRPILAEKEEPESRVGAAMEGFVSAINGCASRLDTESVFDRLRKAAEAAESIPAILAEINALLPDGYCVTKREAEQPAEDRSDWRNWREGDLVECLSNHFGFHKKGKIYEIGEDSSGDFGIRDNQGDVLEDFQPYGQCYNSADFRFHSRPAKVAE